MKSIEVPGLVGQPLLFKGREIGTITSARADKNGLMLRSTVYDEAVKRKLRADLSDSVSIKRHG